MKIKAGKKLRKMSPKKFILNHLIPFILRDAGRGFAMNHWNISVSDDDDVQWMDNIADRKVPACGTVACIGGSIECLTGIRGGGDDERAAKMSKILGLSEWQTHGLFYDWEPYEGGWPEEYAKRFALADTPYKKARVACALLRQIALKGGKVLPNAEEES